MTSNRCPIDSTIKLLESVGLNPVLDNYSNNTILTNNDQDREQMSQTSVKEIIDNKQDHNLLESCLSAKKFSSECFNDTIGKDNSQYNLFTSNSLHGTTQTNKEYDNEYLSRVVKETNLDINTLKNLGNKSTDLVAAINRLTETLTIGFQKLETSISILTDELSQNKKQKSSSLTDIPKPRNLPSLPNDTFNEGNRNRGALISPPVPMSKRVNKSTISTSDHNSPPKATNTTIPIPPSRLPIQDEKPFTVISPALIQKQQQEEAKRIEEEKLKVIEQQQRRVQIEKQANELMNSIIAGSTHGKKNSLFDDVEFEDAAAGCTNHSGQPILYNTKNPLFD